MMSASDTVKRVRIELNMDQEVFAKELDLSKTAVYNYECGIRKPKRSVINKIKALAKLHGIDVSADDLME